MKFTKSIALAGIIFTLITFFACNQEGGGQAEYQTTTTGIKYRIIEQSADQPGLETGQVISLKMTYGTDDTTFFDSNEIPENTMKLEMQASDLEGDFYEMMELLSVGDSAEFYLDAESFFLKTAGFREIPEFAKDSDKIRFNVRIEKSQSQQEMQDEMIAEMERMREEESGLIAEYVETNDYDAEPTPSGMYVVVTEKGSGPKPKPGETVKVHYTGKLLNGTVFDSSVTRGQPFEFPLGQGRVIRGWDEGIAMLNVGSKATLIIPSELGYGERGAGRDIPPFAPLVFEVELLDIVK
jgi:FKBP-type peptidyl-prolyl cis-trans isomerase FkpA